MSLPVRLHCSEERRSWRSPQCEPSDPLWSHSGPVRYPTGGKEGRKGNGPNSLIRIGALRRGKQLHGHVRNVLKITGGIQVQIGGVRHGDRWWGGEGLVGRISVIGKGFMTLIGKETPESGKSRTGDRGEQRERGEGREGWRGVPRECVEAPPQWRKGSRDKFVRGYSVRPPAGVWLEPGVWRDLQQQTGARGTKERETYRRGACCTRESVTRRQVFWRRSEQELRISTRALAPGGQTAWREEVRGTGEGW